MTNFRKIDRSKKGRTRAPRTLADPVQYKGYNPALDGLRGLAIALVLFHHLWPWIWSNSFIKVVTRLSHISWIGVDLFFVLSGFLITGILLDTRTQPNYFKNFLARRTLRIFPAYYLFLVIGIYIIPIFVSHGEIESLQSRSSWYFLYGSNYLWILEDNFLGKILGFEHSGAVEAPDYLGITWSLAVEEQFYLFWPTVIFLLWRYLKVTLLASIISVLITRVFFISLIDKWADATYMASICRVDSLMVGAALALYVRSESFNIKVWHRLIISGLYISLPVAILYQIIIPGRQDPLFSSIGYTILAFGFAGLLAQVILKEETIFSRLSKSPILIWLGRYSYGIYLYHMIFWYLSHQIVNAEVYANGEPVNPNAFAPIGGYLIIDAPIRLIACLGLTLAAAWLSYQCYEKHFLKLKSFFR